jgi:asparagine synthase (glutamine-hydrolysing)
MCGVAGVLCLDPGCDGSAHEPLVRRMCELQACRGPDDSGVAPLGRACLGSLRLAIIDLSSAGHMPMRDESGRYWISYNGEVYNFAELRQELETLGHRFHSHTDTEVVLHAYMEWGERCITRFVGMFAFAIYDRQTGRLALARDRYGIKPLYYARAGGHLAFASEIKALRLAMGGAELDYRRLTEWFLYRNVDAFDTATLQAGVSQVLPGTVVVLDGERITSHRVYDVVEQVAEAEYRRFAEARPEAVVNEIEQLLVEAVRYRLISDVPVGVLLSGGLDSSMVTAIAAKETRQLTTFNVSVAGYPKLDERRFAAELCEHLGLRMVSFDLTAENFRQHLPRTVWLEDLPLTHPNSVAYYLISRVARAEGTIVLLSGEGADELFGGYRFNYRRKWYLARLMPLLRRIPDGLWNVGALLLFARLGMPVTSHGFREVLPPTVDLIDRYRRSGWLAACEEAYGFVARPADRAVLGAMLADLNDFLSPLLRRLDRTSMGASEECRVPFLDHRLVHKAINLPVEYRIGKRANKWVLKQVAERYMPHHLVHRRKKGFPIPVADYVAPYAVRSFFADGFCQAELGLDRRGFERMLGEWRRSPTGLFSLVTFEIWGRLHLRGDSLESVEAWTAGFEPRSPDAPRPATRRPSRPEPVGGAR